MHTPTAFILRRADSPSYFNPGDSPSHHLSHPLTAGPHTLSKHISFFLCCFLYFFIFSLLSVLPPPHSSFLLPPRIPLFVSASSPSACPSLGSSFAVVRVFPLLSLFGRRLFISGHSSFLAILLRRVYLTTSVIARLPVVRIIGRQREAFEQSRLARLPSDLSDYHELPYEKFIAAEQDDR